MDGQGHICCPCPKEKPPRLKRLYCIDCTLEKKTLNSLRCRSCFFKSLKKHTLCHTPLYAMWRNLLYRYAGTNLVCDEWKDFAIFAQDIGEICGRLTRIDTRKPFSKTNFKWK